MTDDPTLKDILSLMNQQYNEMNQRLNQIDQRFNELEQTTDQRFDKLDQRFSKLEQTMQQRFDQVEQAIFELKEDIDFLKDHGSDQLLVQDKKIWKTQKENQKLRNEVNLLKDAANNK